MVRTPDGTRPPHPFPTAPESARMIRRPSAALALLLLAAACTTSAPPAPPARSVDFSTFGPIVLDVAAVGVVDARRPAPAGTVRVDDQLPLPPVEAVRLWAQQRLQTAGTAGRVQVTIREASITEVELPRTGGVRGYFTTDQAQRYDGRIEVEVSGERTTGPTTVRGTAKASVTASSTVPEHISLADRERTLQDLTARMADELNARLDAGIRRDLAALVRR